MEQNRQPLSNFHYLTMNSQSQEFGTSLPSIKQSIEEQPRIVPNLNHTLNPAQTISVSSVQGLSSLKSSNQFLPRRATQGSSFNHREVAQKQADGEQNCLPLKQASKANHFLPDLLQEAILRSRNPHKGFDSKHTPRGEQTQRGEMEKDEVVKEEWQKQAHTARYQELLKKRQQISNRVREVQKIRQSHRYDYKPRQILQKDGQRQTIAVETAPESRSPFNLKTPFLSQAPQSLSPHFRIKQSKIDKRRGYTDNVYIQKFLKHRAQTNHKESPILQKDPVQSGDKQENISLQDRQFRRPGFISYRLNNLQPCRTDSNSVTYKNPQHSHQTDQSIQEEYREGKPNIQVANSLLKIPSSKSKGVPQLSTVPPHQSSTPPRTNITPHQIITPANKRRLQLNSSIVNLSLRNSPGWQEDTSQQTNKAQRLSLQRLVDVPLRPEPSKKDYSPNLKVKIQKQVHSDLKPQLRASFHLPAPITQVHHFKEGVGPQEIYPTKNHEELAFDIIIKNISVNLYAKNFGSKFLELAVQRILYTTEQLHGSHLLWVARGYLFPKVSPTQTIQITLKSQKEQHLNILGRTQVPVNDLLLNYRQLFCQSYIFGSNSQLLAVIILGFQICPRNLGKSSLTASQKPLCKTDHQRRVRRGGSTKINPKSQLLPLKSQRQSPIQNYQPKKHRIRPQQKTRFVTEPQANSQTSDLHEMPFVKMLGRNDS